MNLEKIFYIVASTVLVTLFVLIVFIFSPVSYDDQQINREKVIYYADNISPAHQKIINRFNNEYKGRIRVETINLPFEKFSTNERKELLARYLRSKSSRIDLFSVDIIWVPRFSRWALPLDRMIDTSVINTLLPFTLETCRYQDSLVALPLYADIAVMFYRDDLLRQIPQQEKFRAELAESITWERFAELKRNIQKLPGRNGKPFYYFQADAYEGLICSFFEVAAAKVPNGMKTDDKIFRDAGLVESSITFLQQLVYGSGISPAEVTRLKENESYQKFFENDGFAVRGWPGFMSKTNLAFKEELRGKILPAPVPHIAGTKPVSVFGGWNLMISRFSNNVPEVVKFITYILKEEHQKLLFEEGYLLPAVKSPYTDKEFTGKYPELQFYKKLFEKGKYRPMFEEYTGISDILSSNISKAIEKNTDAATVTGTILRQIEQN
ncbi:MAG: putative ABC transporter-binding protein [Ignavibacteriaceae bacterium]|nr:putative ABC transporter-binding protein [Ignavibacteriaceae bacterium]